MGRIPTALCAAFLVALAAPTRADTTNVGGSILDAIWSIENSPYRVTSTVTVPVSRTLVIEPGVVVLFTSGTKLFVNGSLRAVGALGDTIRFKGGGGAN